MNLLEIIIIVLTAGLGIIGYSRGFVKKLASMLSWVLSIVLVSVFLPYMTDFLKNNTPVYEYIVEQCTQAVAENISDTLLSGTQNDGSQFDTYRNMGRDQIKALMEQNGYDSSVLDSLTDEQIEQYKEEYIQQYIGEYLGGTDAESVEPDSEEQTQLIESLPIPQALKELLLTYNNDESYRSLNVTTFSDYLIQFTATIILNVISFIAAVIVVQLLLWVVITALDILAHIPLIGFINRLAGLLLGFLQALFFIWIFYLILSMISTTEAGMQLMAMVQQSRLLSYLYESNLFMQIVLRAAALFV